MSPFKTLFLDRDGVLNERLVGDYVKTPDQMVLEKGVADALALAAKHFDRLVIVTNQQGIGKKLMTPADLDLVHQKMLAEIEKGGGRIDAIYVCPHLHKDRSFDRKPAIGMGLKARKECPAIRFKKSVMVGDSESDLLFGRRLGMTTIFISSDPLAIQKNATLIDGAFPSLWAWIQTLDAE